MQKDCISMIQRIQTVYLLCTAICGILMYFFPLVSLVPSDETASPAIYHISALDVKVIEDGNASILMRLWPVVILNALIIAFSVFTLLQFRQRVKQIRYTHLLLLMILAQLVFLIFDVEKLSKVAGPGHMMTMGIYSVLPLLQLICTRLATGAIKKDEALVRSAYRLR